MGRDGTRFNSTLVTSPEEPMVPTTYRPSEFKSMLTAELEESISPTDSIPKTNFHQSSNFSCQLLESHKGNDQDSEDSLLNYKTYYNPKVVFNILHFSNISLECAP